MAIKNAQDKPADEDEEGGDEEMADIDDSVTEASTKYAKSDDNNIESASSAGSSEDKTSGGGYSADYSSDQSSDDTNSRKDGSIKLSVERFNLHEARSRQNVASSSGRASSLDDGEAKSTGSHQGFGEVRKDTAGKHAKVRTSQAREETAEQESGRHTGPRRRKSRLAADIESMMKPRNHELENAPIRDGSGQLPQWNGVRITHPMDPRIDLSTVGHLKQAPGVPLAATSSAPSDAGGQASGPPPPTMENYLQLMEVVRPFFHAHGILPAKNASASEGLQGAAESEGFTSFFTTTHSSTNNSGSPSNSDMDKKPKAKPAPAEDPEEDDADVGSDTSSMVVLARVKRKYRRSEESEESNTSLTSRERRVRIQEDRHVLAQADGGQGDNDEQNQDDDQAAAQESSMSSSSSERRHVEVADPIRAPAGLPPRIVTDISSSNRTDSNASNTNSGSGSGSAENAGTGSGSNQGSSGSGNDAKGSSEDVAKEDNSGEGTNEGSDGASSGNKKIGLGLHLGGVAHRHEGPCLEAATKHTALEDQVMQESEEAARERKLLVKKRKRIEMRREYEAQQRTESSHGDIFRPGHPVTLDQALVFSSIPRIIIQSTPPFLVVHTNAAYCRLTGIDAHNAVGSPITLLLSVSDGFRVGNRSDGEANQDDISSMGPDNQAGELAAAEAAGRARASRQNTREVRLERLIASSGFGHLHSVHVHVQQHNLLGKNVTIVNEPSLSAPGNVASHAHSRDEGSNSTSLTSSADSPTSTIMCQVAIAPIVSSPDAVLDRATVTDRECSSHPKSKRRKLVGSTEQESHRKRPAMKEATHHRKHHLHQIVTHFAIQLHSMCQAAAKQGSVGSVSANSTSVEARLLGLTKEELRNQRLTVWMPQEDEEMLAEEEDGAASDSAEVKAPVSAIG